MNYIVFDLEWNQSPDGKKNRNEKLPFEIHRDRGSEGKQQKGNHRQLSSSDPASGI